MNNLKDDIEKLIPNDLVLLDLIQDNSRQALTLVVDGEKTIDLKRTAILSRRLQDSGLLDEIYPGGFQLEVTSPGIDAPLKHPFQYKKNIGRKLTVLSITEDTPIVIKLNAVDKVGFSGITLSGETVRYNYDHIQTAKVLIEFS